MKQTPFIISVDEIFQKQVFWNYKMMKVKIDVASCAVYLNLVTHTFTSKYNMIPIFTP